MKRVKKRRKNKYKPSIKELTKSKEIIITENDKIIYVYKQNDSYEYIEVTNVSYIAKIDDEWIPLVRYDSTHGYLHRHTRVLFSDKREATDTEDVIKEGSHHVWLTWALKDLISRFTEYRRLFMKRSGMVDNNS